MIHGAARDAVYVADKVGDIDGIPRRAMDHGGRGRVLE